MLANRFSIDNGERDGLAVGDALGKREDTTETAPAYSAVLEESAGGERIRKRPGSNYDSDAPMSLSRKSTEVTNGQCKRQRSSWPSDTERYELALKRTLSMYRRSNDSGDSVSRSVWTTVGEEIHLFSKAVQAFWIRMSSRNLRDLQIKIVIIIVSLPTEFFIALLTALTTDGGPVALCAHMVFTLFRLD